MIIVWICVGAAVGILATLILIWGQQFHGLASQRSLEQEWEAERKKCKICGKPTESKDVDGNMVCHQCFVKSVYKK